MFSKRMYYFATAFNLIGRMTWAITLMPPSLIANEDVNQAILTLSVSTIEILRRCVWADIRLENEHLNNSSKYRAMLWIPRLIEDAEDVTGPPPKDNRDTEMEQESSSRIALLGYGPRLTKSASAALGNTALCATSKYMPSTNIGASMRRAVSLDQDLPHAEQREPRLDSITEDNPFEGKSDDGHDHMGSGTAGTSTKRKVVVSEQGSEGRARLRWNKRDPDNQESDAPSATHYIAM